jgi:hypothetical protein
MRWDDPRDGFASGVIALRKRHRQSEAVIQLRKAQEWQRADVRERIEFGLCDEFEQRVAR